MVTWLIYSLYCVFLCLTKSITLNAFRRFVPAQCFGTLRYGLCISLFHVQRIYKIALILRIGYFPTQSDEGLCEGWDHGHET